MKTNFPLAIAATGLRATLAQGDRVEAHYNPNTFERVDASGEEVEG